MELIPIIVAFAAGSAFILLAAKRAMKKPAGKTSKAFKTLGIEFASAPVIAGGGGPGSGETPK